MSIVPFIGHWVNDMTNWCDIGYVFEANSSYVLSLVGPTSW